MEEVARIIIDTVQPINAVGKALGLLPAHVTKSGELRLSPLAFLYTSLVFLFSLYNLFYIAIWCDYFGSEVKPSTIAAKVYVVHKISQGIIFCVSFANSLLTLKYNVKRFEKIIIVNALLKDIGVKIYDGFKVTSINAYIMVLSLWIAVFVTDYFMLFVWNNANLSFYSWFIGNSVVVYNSLLLFQLSFITKFFTHGFVTINKELTDINLRKPLVKKFDERNNPLLFITTKKRVIILIHAHDMYVEFIETWHKQNRLQILLLVITNIIAVTGNLHYIISEILDFGNEKSINFYTIIYSSYWCVLIYVKMLVLISKKVELTDEVWHC